MFEYQRKSSSSLRESRKSELLLQVQRAEEALDTSQEVLACVAGLVKNWKPVVLCRDCKHRNRQVLAGGFAHDTCGSPYGLRGELRGDDFCPYGEAGAAE